MTPTEETILNLLKDFYYKYGETPTASMLISLYSAKTGKDEISRQAMNQHLNSLADKKKGNGYLIKVPHKWILK